MVIESASTGTKYGQELIGRASRRAVTNNVCNELKLATVITDPVTRRAATPVLDVKHGPHTGRRNEAQAASRIVAWLAWVPRRHKVK